MFSKRRLVKATRRVAEKLITVADSIVTPPKSNFCYFLLFIKNTFSDSQLRRVIAEQVERSPEKKRGRFVEKMTKSAARELLRRANAGKFVKSLLLFIKNSYRCGG